MSIIGIVVSVISASYYLKIVRVLMDETNINYKNNKNQTAAAYFLNLDGKKSYYITLSNHHSFLISCLTLMILLFILKPSIILNSTQLLSLSLFNF